MDPELLKAKNYAFLLLKYRLRSTEEIRDRLKRKKFSAQAIEATIKDLSASRFLDDEAFAKAWIEYRLNNKIGIRRLRVELGTFGIPKETVSRQLESIKDDYNEEEIIQRVIKQKVRKLASPVDLTAKRRIYAYLLRRGFSPEVVSDNIKQL
ncbi:MAG: regulatory protein RecX [Candidatus Omnitrophica bacterium]|nr:regulatory protein RecX [Candidatus Omnitrophota bacterium]